MLNLEILLNIQSWENNKHRGVGALLMLDFWLFSLVRTPGELMTVQRQPLQSFLLALLK